MTYLNRFLALACTLFLSLPVAAELPYAQAGLTSEEAAAHLLSRLTFGAKPGEVDQVARDGLEAWFEKQLRADQRSPQLDRKLARLKPMTMTSRELAETYPPRALVFRLAEQEGVITKDARADRKKLLQDPDFKKFAEQRGYRPFRELTQALIAQKLLSANESPNQLEEVMVDFWFNHFNVSVTDNQARQFILSYERDGIRPHALGSFLDLLQATAKHPAMLTYLDNFQSSANPEAQTFSEMMVEDMGRPARRAVGRLQKQKKGINENYARELMELHTLGVDGGYTQEDVTEVARAFTGWSLYPRLRAQKFRQRIDQGRLVGIQQQGDFLFVAPFHDAEAKTVLGHRFPAGGGLEEGEKILEILSQHPSTAHHLGRKMAVRFVSDNPPEALVNRLASTFQASRGDTRELLRTLVHSPEFWSAEAQRSKIKSPFELVISATRALNATIVPRKPLYDWLKDMGQPLYAYQAPTGFPDEGDWWINSGTLLTRMNFGLNLAQGEIPGVRYDQSALARFQDPKQALETYARQLLPGRPVEQAIEPLLPTAREFQNEAEKKNQHQTTAKMVGLILGSPEFQRR